jgi:cation diffusion facilitator family transporter
MDISSKALIKSFFSNLFLSIIKVVFGFIGKSSALIADGVHSFSDLSTDAVAIFGNHYALKPADKEHPFGHGKIEYLTCLMIGIVVSFLGFEIIYKSFQTNIVIPSKMIIFVSIFTIILKYILASYLLRVGIKEDNAILIASGKESSADVLSSIFVLLSSILMQFSNKIIFLKYSNLIATIIVGLFIIKTGFQILKDNVSSILGEQENSIKIDEMLDMLNQEEKIIQIDNFIAIKNGPYFQITGEVSMDETMSLKEVHSIVDILEDKIKKLDNRAKYINIHVNPIDISKK